MQEAVRKQRAWRPSGANAKGQVVKPLPRENRARRRRRQSPKRGVPPPDRGPSADRGGPGGSGHPRAVRSHLAREAKDTPRMQADRGGVPHRRERPSLDRRHLEACQNCCKAWGQSPRAHGRGRGGWGEAGQRPAGGRQAPTEKRWRVEVAHAPGARFHARQVSKEQAGAASPKGAQRGGRQGRGAGAAGGRGGGVGGVAIPATIPRRRGSEEGQAPGAPEDGPAALDRRHHGTRRNC